MYHAELVGLVEHLRQGFSAADAEHLVGMWADDDGSLVYVAGERSRPLRTRGEIAQYYRDALGPAESVDTAEVVDRVIDASRDRARAFSRFRFAGRDAATGARFDVNIQVTVADQHHDD